ncbi:MAG TPA: hypothetical protein PKE29_00740 [Phycisphaerales bacterium]|nr:hypothetical protein [Phycisphaerales bacterium]
MFRIARLALSTASILCLSALAPAQPGAGPGSGGSEVRVPAKAGQPATGALVLSDEAFRLDSVGLSVRFPVGCQVRSNRVGDRQTVQIVPESSTWILNIQTPQTTNAGATIQEAMDQTITLIQGSNAVTDKDQQNFYDNSVEAKLLEKTDNLTLPGGPAARFYISVPRGDKSYLNKGYTIFKPTAHQFVVFEFICHEVDFPKLRGTYETIVGTANFEKADALMLSRGTAIKAGAALIAGLSEQDYAAAMGDKELWFRLYRPAKSGLKVDDTEIGYKGLKFWKGKRGEINPDKPRANWSKSEQQEGYLAQLRTRIMREDNKIIDAVSIAYMTPDRSEETWMIVTSVKEPDGREVAHASETGARNKSNIMISKSEARRPPMTLNPPMPPEGYLSQFEWMILPRLLVLKRTLVETGFYWWGDFVGADGGAVSFHRCSLTQQGPLLTLTITARDATQSQTSLYGEKGEFIRSDLSGGALVWEPTELSPLKQLWERKGLPVDR